MGELEALTLIVGFFLPPVIAIIQQPTWSEGARSVVTVIICSIVGLLTVYIEQGHELHFGKQLLGQIAQVIIAAQAAYVAFWKRHVAPAIERLTSPSPGG